MLFSILIANYNNGHFFKDCYKSIVSQAYTQWEAIIVDDGSTDNSVKMIRQIIGDDPRFRFYLNIKNKGCGFTKNKCAQLAKGEILGFLDPDDALKPYALEIMVANHKKNEDVAIITSKYELVDLQMNFIENCSHGRIIPNNKSYLTFGEGAFTHFASFKKNPYQISEGINPKMKRAVDQDLYYKMEEQGKHLFIDDVLYSYRVHENSISQNENLFKAQYWHFYAMEKAYKRRRRIRLKIDNFSRQSFKEHKSNYYLSRFERIKQTNKIGSKYYFIFRTLLVHPLYDFKLKIKSLMLLFLGRI